MRLSVCLPMFFPKMKFEEAIPRIARLGFDACEAWRLPADQDEDALVRACRENHVDFLAFCPDRFAMTGPDDEKPYLESLQNACERAGRLNVKMLITQVGPDTGEAREIQHGRIVSCLKRAVPILESSGVTLLVEPLNVLVDHKGYYLSSSLEGFAIIREVASENVKLLFDIYHQQVGEGNLLANMTGNLPLIGHLHAAGCPGRHEPDNGEIDYPFLFDALDRAGCTGACALEYKPLLPAEESLKKARKLIKK